MFVYADNAATTCVSKTALNAMLPYLTEQYGNPSSLYSFGQNAQEALQKARETVARCLNADPREIYFTSGGSEADNQAIVSAARLGARKGKRHLISTKFEHHAVLHTLAKLEKEGFEVTLLDVHEDGVVRLSDLEAAIREDTALVTVMFANNEIGTVQPIAEIGALCREKKIPFHCDAVQAAGHMPIDVKALQVDMLAISGHKFHAPKGVGALYARKGMVLTNIIEGGAQERGKRAGTENVAGIVAMAAALEESCAHMEENAAKIIPMRDKLFAELGKIPHSRINGSREKHVPGTVNMCFEGIEGESLLLLWTPATCCWPSACPTRWPTAPCGFPSESTTAWRRSTTSSTPCPGSWIICAACPRCGTSWKKASGRISSEITLLLRLPRLRGDLARLQTQAGRRRGMLGPNHS